MVQQTQLMGKMAVESAIDIVNGKKVPARAAAGGAC